MKQLDLGCGNIPRQASNMDEIYGVDIADQSVITNENVKAGYDLAIQSIPYEDNSFDLVTAHDFMEHIPSFVYLPDSFMALIGSGGVIKRNSMIELFNEIYRVLKDGGEFYMESPMYPHEQAFQDPTHVFFWTPATIHYFSGDYSGFHDHYGHTSKFQLISKKLVGSRIYMRLKAVKPCEPPFNVGEVI